MKRITIFALIVLLVAACTESGPVIGISSGLSEGRLSLRDEYSNAISRAGGIPVIIPVTTDSILIEEYVKLLDGLILSGGEDIQPAYYGEEVLNETVQSIAIRDTSDILLLDAALRAQLPLMAICRGEQLVKL